jgi:hypothetical protein
MDNPYYGSWDYNDLDEVGWNEDGSPYVRPIHRPEAHITYPPAQVSIHISITRREDES